MNPAGLEPKSLFRRIQMMCAQLGRARAPRTLAEQFVPRLLEEIAEPAGIRTIQLYERRADSLALRGQWGREHSDLARELGGKLADGAGEAELPWVGAVGTRTAGLIAFGADASWLLALLSAPDGDDDGAGTHMLSLLLPLQFALQQQVRRGRLESALDQARAIQMSLLPPGRPSFADFDICAATVPAEDVGGDLYDFLALDAETLGIAVADASGHGLPAALQARDVVTGLRMGVERDLKITRTIEKLNCVIHRSGLVTRFISMIFGELEANGNLLYINAGHPPGLLIDGRGVSELSVGGMILGPRPDAAYKMGFAHLDRGSALALYTDGVIEQGTRRGEAFGEERLRAWLADWRSGPADRAIEDLLARLRDFGDGAFDDDVTAMLLVRPR